MKYVFLLLLFLVSTSVQITKDYTIKGLGLVDTDELQEQYGFLGNNDKVYISEYAVQQKIEESYGAWQTPPAGFLDHSILIGGWTINHPMQNEQQSNLGCDNPYRALFENEEVYYIRENTTENEVLCYLRENYDENIDMEYVKEKGGFQVYRYFK